jgi:hypothetical protein
MRTWLRRNPLAAGPKCPSASIPLLNGERMLMLTAILIAWLLAKLKGKKK